MEAFTLKQEKMRNGKKKKNKSTATWLGSSLLNVLFFILKTCAPEKDFMQQATDGCFCLRYIIWRAIFESCYFIACVKTSKRERERDG